MTDQYNKTQLNIDKAAEREIVHRDYIAHCLRWTHILRHAKMGMNVLDVGCGMNLPLAMMFYTNKFKPKYYCGLDIRTKFEKSKADFNFRVDTLGGFDVTKESDWDKLESARISWDIVSCLEVIEHMPKSAGLRLLENLSVYSSKKSIIFLSTPCYNGSKAGNHIYEWGYDELRMELQRMFTIEAHYGTFASQRDLLPHATPAEKEVWNNLKPYYDSNLLSILLAPAHPQFSRNCIWRLRVK